MDKRIAQLVNQVKNHLIERYGDKIRELFFMVLMREAKRQKIQT